MIPLKQYAQSCFKWPPSCRKYLLLIAALAGVILAAGRFGKAAEAAQSRRDMATAQRNRNLLEVGRLSREYTRLLGSKAGVPDRATTFSPIPNEATRLTAEECRRAFTPMLERLEQDAWWTKRPETQDMPYPLRMVASVVEGCLAARRAGCDHPDRLLQAACGAADFLVWAQEQGGKGCFPYPAMRGKAGRQGELAEQGIAKATAQGRLGEVLHNGWFITDDGNGDLQFDNGVAGVAVLRCYEATRDEKYLRSARAAADWATTEPAVRNWNYNSFAVFLLSEMFRCTGERKYLVAAKEKAQLGIYPGQLTEGPQRGRWNDPHNARLVYHYILLRGLATLVAVLPDDDVDLPRAREALVLGLQVRNAEIVRQGAAHPETVLDTLCRIVLALRLASLPPDAGVPAAYDAMVRFASSQSRNGSMPVPPGAWGLMLESLRQPP